MKLSEIMTAPAVTASIDDSVRSVAQLMRSRNVGSVVLLSGADRPVAMVTDRDITVSAVAEEADLNDQISNHCTQPIVCGEPEMALEEAAALMVQNKIRRLPVVDGGTLAGIVTLDDIAIRTGNLEVVQKMTWEIAEAALPDYYFRER